MTPYFQHDNVIIYCGECSEVMERVLDNDSVDLTITSPPYDNQRVYEGYIFNFESIAKQLWRATKKCGVVVWVVADQTINGSETGTSFRQALKFMEIGFNQETMIYQVAGTGAKGSNYYYWQAFEYMFVFAKGQPKTSNRIADLEHKTFGFMRSNLKDRGENRGIGKSYFTKKFGVRTNIWRYSVGFMNNSDLVDHLAPFPEALARDHIISWSNPGDVVLDPMLGSGTTLKMAVLTKRKFIGIEISEKYCEIAAKRYESALKELAGYTPQEIKKNIDITNKRLF